MKTDYAAAMRHLHKLEMFGIKLGLQNITRLCRALGNPQDDYRIIHVAGTNGKGSVATMCSEILKKAGYRVGTYTSPHMQTFRERIQVNGRKIVEAETAGIFLEVKKAADNAKGAQITYFEFTTAMAFLHFKGKKCDFAVIETGLGGRLDATNIVKPLVTIITNIGLEHTQYLGNTKQKIAFEKAGIIKPGSVTVTGEKDEKIRAVLRRISSKKKSEFIAVKEDYKGNVSLPGEHQKRNAAVAAAAIKSLGRFGIRINRKCIQKGLESVKWPGRLEVVQKNPAVILDSAHNPHAAEALAGYIRELDNEVIMVLGISDDKDATGIIRILAPLAKKVILTQAKYRGKDCRILKKEAVKYNKNVTAEKNVGKAVKKALKSSRNETVLITGSIFVAGEARELWHLKER